MATSLTLAMVMALALAVAIGLWLYGYDSMDKAQSKSSMLVQGLGIVIMH